MAPTKWTTTEQAEFLTGLYPRYLEHTADKSYHRFWAELFTEWFARWPERATLFPNIEGVLNAEQGEALGAAVDTRKKRLQTWFRWRANESRRGRLQQKKSSVFEKIVAPKGSRIRTPTELYMLEHYDDRIKPQITAEQQAGTIPAFGNNLTAVRKYAQELLESEDGEIKEKIQLMYEMQEKISKATYDSDGEEETDPAEIKRAIDDLPYALARVAKLVKRRTRFAISFVCAGPDPSRNWDISSISCHPDTTASGHTFPSLFPKESNAMLVAFQEYAETIFPPELRDPTKSEGTLEVLLADEGRGDGDIAIEDSGDSMENPKTEEDGGPESENQYSGAGDEGVDDAEGEEIDEGGQEYAAAIVEGDQWQVTSDASQSFDDLDASFGTWRPSGTAGPSPDQSTIQFNASTQPQDLAAIGFQSHLGIDLGSQAAGDIPQLMTVQSIPTFAGSGSGYASGDFSYDDPTNGISLSAVMREITADLSGDSNWDFSGIGLHSLGTPPLSDLRSTQFGDTDARSDAELLPLPPVPNNPSPVRPHLPAVPPPSSPGPDERAMATPSQQKTTKSCPQPRPKGNAVVPPKHRPARDTTKSVTAGTKSATAGAIDGPSLLGCVGTSSLEKSTAKSRRKPRVKHNAAVLSEHQPAGGTTCDASATASSVQPQPQNHLHPAPSTNTTTSQRTAPTTSAVPVTEQPHVSAPSETRTSKRVPVQSKRNAIADAIGTNQQAFISTSPKKGKRSGECAEGAKKRKKAN